MLERIDMLFQEALVVINIGLHQFADSLKEQGIEVVQVDWMPPAGGDKDMIHLLDQMS